MLYIFLWRFIVDNRDFVIYLSNEDGVDRILGFLYIVVCILGVIN